LDFSVFKNFQLNERLRMEFRSEFFNILNHPNFNAPGFGGNGVVAVSGSTNFYDSTFGETGSTRDGAYSSREVQFALKLYSSLERPHRERMCQALSAGTSLLLIPMPWPSPIGANIRTPWL